MPFKAIQIPDLSGKDLECIYVPFPTKLVYVLRLFFSEMMLEGIYDSKEDAERGIEYFSEIEAAMLNCANTTQTLTDNQNQNFCVLVSIIVPLLTEGAITPQVAMGLCSVLRLGFQEGEESPEYATAMAQLSPLLEAGVGKNTNQLESMQAQLLNLIAGPGTAPVID